MDGPGSGRHAARDVMPSRAPGSRVLVVGGSPATEEMLLDRLAQAGHRLAAHHSNPHRAPGAPRGGPVTRRSTAAAGATRCGPVPVRLAADRSDPADLAQLVVAAERVLDGLDAVVLLPGAPAPAVALASDGAAWADRWSRALRTEVVALACLAQAAARSFIGNRRAGQIVLVVREPAREGSRALDAAVGAAVTALGTELARELRDHDVAVTTLTIGESGASNAPATVAALVEAALSARPRSGVGVRIG